MRWFAANVSLDQAQFADALQGFGRQRLGSGLMQVVECFPGMSPACCFMNRAVCVKGVEAHVRICSQYAFEVGHVVTHDAATAASGLVGHAHC
jgi:hypothetical protein